MGVILKFLNDDNRTFGRPNFWHMAPEEIEFLAHGTILALLGAAKKPCNRLILSVLWSGCRDLNPGPLAPQTRAQLPLGSCLRVFSMAYTDSGRLLPLTADRAG
jgi:hypothetical protein